MSYKPRMPEAELRGGATSSTSWVDAEVGGDLLDRHSGFTIPSNAHDVVAELLWVGLGHDGTLPGSPQGASHIRCHLSVQQTRSSVSRFLLLPDTQWAVATDLLPGPTGRMGRPFPDAQTMVEGIVYRHRTGIAWRDLPVVFGRWQTVWKWHRCLADDGLWDTALDRLLSAADAANQVEEVLDFAYFLAHGDDLRWEDTLDRPQTRVALMGYGSPFTIDVDLLTVSPMGQHRRSIHGDGSPPLASRAFKNRPIP